MPNAKPAKQTTKQKNPKELKDKDLEQVRLRPKTKQFIDLLDGNSKLSQTQAYIDTHQTNSRVTAKVEASKLLTKPNVILYRKKHAQMAVRNVVAMASDKRVHEATRLKANIDILDRFDGKAIQRVQTEATNLNINMEASKELGDSFTQFLKGKTQI